jgi:hypothetical protein
LSSPQEPQKNCANDRPMKVPDRANSFTPYLRYRTIAPQLPLCLAVQAYRTPDMVKIGEFAKLAAARRPAELRQRWPRSRDNRVSAGANGFEPSVAHPIETLSRRLFSPLRHFLFRLPVGFRLLPILPRRGLAQGVRSCNAHGRMPTPRDGIESDPCRNHWTVGFTEVP